MRTLRIATLLALAVIVLGLVLHAQPQERSEWGAARQATSVAVASDDKNLLVFLTEFPHQATIDQDDQTSQNQTQGGDSARQWILIGITAITAGFICWQAWETRKAAQAARQNIELVVDKERPRISVYVGKIDLSLPESESSPAIHSIAYVVHCDGATPAINVDARWQSAITSSFDPPAERSYVPMVLPSSLNPRAQGYECTAYLPKTVLSPSEVEDINQGRSVVHFWGIIDYEDVFKNSWRTSFRYVWGKPQGLPRPYWSQCGPPGNNRAT
jgi:hypothetical protein